MSCLIFVKPRDASRAVKVQNGMVLNFKSPTALTEMDLGIRNDAKLKAMEEKLEAWEDFNDDEEWAKCQLDNLQKAIEQEGVLNHDEKFPGGAGVKVRLLQNFGEKRSGCLKMDFENSTVDDFMKEMEEYGVIDYAEDYMVLYNARPVQRSSSLGLFAEGWLQLHHFHPEKCLVEGRWQV